MIAFKNECIHFVAWQHAGTAVRCSVCNEGHNENYSIRPFHTRPIHVLGCERTGASVCVCAHVGFGFHGPAVDGTRQQSTNKKASLRMKYTRLFMRTSIQPYALNVNTEYECHPKKKAKKNKWKKRYSAYERANIFELAATQLEHFLSPQNVVCAPV